MPRLLSQGFSSQHARTHARTHSVEAPNSFSSFPFDDKVLDYKEGKVDYAVFISWIAIPLGKGKIANELEALLKTHKHFRIIDDIQSKPTILNLKRLATPSKTLTFPELKGMLFRSPSLATISLSQVSTGESGLCYLPQGTI